MCPSWWEGGLRARRGSPRRRVRGAGRCLTLWFSDRLVLTLAHLRLGIPHEALAVGFGVGRSTRAILQVRPLLAGRGLPGRVGYGYADWRMCSLTPLRWE